MCVCVCVCVCVCLCVCVAIKRQTEDPQTATKIGKPPVSPINDSNDPFSKDRIRPKKLGKKKINKADIGRPTDFRYV